MDFDQIYIETPLGHGKEIIRFGDQTLCVVLLGLLKENIKFW